MLTPVIVPHRQKFQYSIYLEIRLIEEHNNLERVILSTDYLCSVKKSFRGLSGQMFSLKKQKNKNHSFLAYHTFLSLPSVLAVDYSFLPAQFPQVIVKNTFLRTEPSCGDYC